ncbi:hypothetical protein POUND7_018872 [Theobroma cacao]
MGSVCEPEFAHDLLLKILLKLPVKSFTRFKCVCKHWNFLTSDPEFIGRYLKTMAALESHHDFLLYDFVRGPFYMRILSDRHGDDAQQVIQATNLKIPYCDLTLSMNPTKFFVVIGHYDGLLCVGIQSVKSRLQALILWNPSLQDLKQIPVPRSWRRESWRVLGFGRDFSTDDYKILRVSNEYGVSEYSDVEIMSMKNNSIINAEKDLPYFAKSKQKSTFANGCLYWFACKPLRYGIYHDLILRFDLAKEKVREVSPPPCRVDSCSLSLFRGCLCVLRHNKITGDTDLWVRKKQHGMHKSWMKLITLPETPNYGKIWRPFPICYIRNKVLVSADNKNFFLFNPNDESYQKLVVHGITYWAKIFPYVESLVSPYSITKA